MLNIICEKKTIIVILDNSELRIMMSKKSQERVTELMNIDNYRRAIFEQYENKR